MRELLAVFVDDGGEPAQQPRPVAGRDRPPGLERGRRLADRDVGIGQRGRRDLGDDLLGRRVEDLHVNYSLSKPRRSSQSVTAASKAVSSTRALLA